MPWTVDDVDKHIKGLSNAQKRKWVAIANNVLRQCQSKNSGDDCEAMAIRTANSKFGRKSMNAEAERLEMIRQLVDEKMKQYFGDDADNEDDAELLGEAVWSRKYVNDLPDSAFALILPGGTKDDEGKTKPRSLRKLPYKDADGNIDLPHLRNALARLPQLRGVSQELKDKALRTLRAVAKKVLPTYQSEEREDLITAYAVSYVSELDIAVNKLFDKVAFAVRDYAIVDRQDYSVYDVFSGHPDYGDSAVVRDFTDDRYYLVQYVIDADGKVTIVPKPEWQEVKIAYVPESEDEAPEEAPPDMQGEAVEEAGKRINRKVLDALKQSHEAISAILKWAEYQDETGDEDMGDEELAKNESEEQEVVTSEIAEVQTGHILSLTERTEGKTTPLYLDVVLIQPGFGNKRDNHYYSRELLEKYAQVFEGAKMYATDHRQDEKSVGTWVSTVKRIKGYTDDGAPIAEVVIHKDWFAEDVLALNEAGILDKMECSILAVGTAKRGRVNGAPAMVVETIDAVSSVDWVTRAGAGGHALQLSESEAMDDEIVVEESENAESVKITEQALEQDKVMAEIAKSNLPNIARERLVSRQYKDLSELQLAVQAEIEYIKAMTNSGRPFAERTQSINEQEQLPHTERVDAIIKRYIPNL